MKTSMLSLLFLAFGAGAGWFSTESWRDAGDSIGAVPLSPRQIRAQERRRTGGPPAGVIAQLAPVHAAKTARDRTHAIIRLAESIPIADLADWCDHEWIDDLGAADINLFYRIALCRWQDADPVGFMAYALSHNLAYGQEMAVRWARKDPAGALLALQSPEHTAGFKTIRETVFRELAASAPSALLGLAALGSIEYYELDDSFAILAEQHPELLAAAELPAGLKADAGHALTKARLLRNFETEFARMVTSPAGRDDFSNFAQSRFFDDFAKRCADRILDALGSLPPEWVNLVASNFRLVSSCPEKWLALDMKAVGMSDETISRLKSAAYQSLSSTEPERALELLWNDRGTMTAAPYCLSAAIGSLARLDRKRAAQWCDRLRELDLPAELLHGLGGAIEQASPEPSTSEMLLGKFVGLEQSGSGVWELAQRIGKASPEVRDEFSKSLLAMPTEQVARVFKQASGTISGLPRSIQGIVLDAAIRHPDVVGVTSQYDPCLRAAARLAADWVVKDSPAACSWACGLPDGESRRWALRNLAASWLPTDTVAARAWISKLSAADRADVEEFLANKR